MLLLALLTSSIPIFMQMTANFSSMNDNMCAHTYWTLLHIVIFHVYLMINCTFSDVFGPKNKQFVLAMFTEFMEECIACRSAVRILKNTELILFCLLFQVCKTYFWSIFDHIIVKNHLFLVDIWSYYCQESFIYAYCLWSESKSFVIYFFHLIIYWFSKFFVNFWFESKIWWW